MRLASGGSIEREARDRAEEAARRASLWIERMARIGYAAYGTVYVLIGALALRAAFGGGGEATGQAGAVASILSAPLGRTLLGAVALGLFGYAAWRFLQGATDPDNECDGAKGVVKRVDHIANAVLHSALALTAARLALGPGGGSGSADDWTAALMSQPFGRWLVLAAGAGILAGGAYQFREAYKAGFMDNLKPGGMGLRQRRWATRAGRVGFSARGVVFCVIGAFVIQAAATFDPRDARGVGGALETLSRQSFGPYLLGGVALGLVAYGAFMFVVARYRRVNPT